MKKINVPMLLAFLVLPLLAGIFGAYFTSQSIPTWYAGLEKPWFTPPNWAFGPVWTTLYLLMGIAAYIVADSEIDHKQKKGALGVFGFQLALNGLWSFFFFGLQSPLLGLIEIVFLWLSIVWTIWLFAKISKTTIWLLAPYLLWVSLATGLNFSILMLN